MKIEDREKPKPEGEPLSSFSLGNCIRLVQDTGESFVGRVYIVAAGTGVGQVAVNLSDGYYRHKGRFMLEPHAKVVIK